ncbi:MAG: hypothetical protein HC881_15895 [Leptolyngbyaceae cyanobacterium SL_7_1]|nr:hypothetical protein [Leptolyngbyaceae cyanobacterium SL_7_1]
MQNLTTQIAQTLVGTLGTVILWSIDAPDALALIQRDLFFGRNISTGGRGF